jgi:hypothetical protein
MCPFNGVSVRTKKGSHIGCRSYKYKMFNGCDLSSRHHQFAGPVVGQILDLLVMDRQRAINGIYFAIATGGRDNIRAKEMDFSLGQV